MQPRNMQFYCEECGTDTLFSPVELEEETTVKDLTFTNKHTYYQCQTCQTMFEPFDNIDVNYLSDFNVYCHEKNLLTSNEIREIRENYQLSQRDFGKLLAIGHATISRIEKGEIHSEQHDVLFRLAKDPYSFYTNIVEQRKNVLRIDIYQSLRQRLIFLIKKEQQSLSENREKLQA